jgi:hypothetical protein
MTFEPSLALQTAIRAHLVALPAVTSLVPADHIRARSTRPDKLPAIVIANGMTQFLGRAAGGQYVARVFLDLHIWAIEAGADTAKTIGGALAAALRDAPASAGFVIDEWALTRIVWPRDPKPDYGHGVVSIEAAIRWTI